ncbi:MAG TPA: prepilin-type N-terminal cleavage/methylation domain-containing protein [Chthoniobacterales bacterium]|nr:prepilin-type N-terminal cleavage/methylation domain-containing protein [Chthoniobacterales bacterium]
MRPIVNALKRCSPLFSARTGPLPVRYGASYGFSLVEILVALAIVAVAAGFIAISILGAMKQQNSRICLTNMLTIEAAKDEFARDHPGATAIPSVADFAPYFRFGIPRCPDNKEVDYNNLLDLKNPVSCSVHPENTGKLNAGK